MARDGPDTATSDFFICIGDQPELDFGGKRNPDGQGFAAFGAWSKGMDVVRKIQAAPAEGQTLKPPRVIIEQIAVAASTSSPTYCERMARVGLEHRRAELDRRGLPPGQAMATSGSPVTTLAYQSEQ